MRKIALAVLLSMVLVGSSAACSAPDNTAVGGTTDMSALASGIHTGQEPSAEVSQEVSKVPAERVALNERSLTLHPGEKCPLRVTLQPSNADDSGLVWTSSDESIVTVTSQGKIKALTDGQVTITVTTPEQVTSSCRVTVYPGEYYEEPEEEEKTSEPSAEESSEESSKESSKESSEESSEESSKEESQEESSKPAGASVDTSWFDDAIFIGDSVTFGLYNYAENGCLGDADFLAIDCMGYCAALRGLDDEYGIHPVYNGVKVMLDEAVEQIGKKNVFIMLGINDICTIGADETVERMEEFVDRLLARCPDIHIYMESVTPLIAAKDGTRDDYLNNANITRYNEQLQAVCAQRGFTYIDLYPAVADDYGYLRDDYCVDAHNLGFHMNSTGLQAWVDYLKQVVGG